MSFWERQLIKINEHINEIDAQFGEHCLSRFEYNYLIAERKRCIAIRAELITNGYCKGIDDLKGDLNVYQMLQA